MTSDEMFAEVGRICTENARLVNENQRIWPRLRPDGSVRIQLRLDGRWVRNRYKHYTSVQSAYAAAVQANRKARRWADEHAA